MGILIPHPLLTQTRGAQVTPPISAPAAPSHHVQHPEASERGTDGWPLSTVDAPQCPQPSLFPGKAAAPLPSLSLIYCLEKLGQSDGGRGQGGHCHRPVPKGPAQPCSCPRAVGTPGFPVGGNGSSAGGERKDQKKGTLASALTLDAPGYGDRQSRKLGFWALPRAEGSARSLAGKRAIKQVFAPRKVANSLLQNAFTRLKMLQQQPPATI